MRPPSGTQTAGSPPHMRGKGIAHLLKLWAERITPAYAGKRNSFRPLRCRHRDHPRICGEKCDPAQHNVVPVGSPPHMRGKEEENPMNRFDLGITPAYAGKRLRGNNRRGRNEDHPRICGEKPFISFHLLIRRGSPPHMRGKETATRKTSMGYRITPAYAGKSLPLKVAKHKD